jgi:spermidine synthase
MFKRTGDTLWRRDGEIFLVSVLILFLELLLIRWISTEIRIFAYLGNLVLVVCFFGVGLGCYLAARPIDLTRLGLNLLLLVVLVSNPLHVNSLDLRKLSLLLSGFEDSPVWNVTWDGSATRVAAAFALIGALLYLVAVTFLPLGQILGRAFQQHPRTIRAYSVNIAGSLAGVWLFNVLSWASAAPPLWFALAAALTAPLILSWHWRGWINMSLTAAAALVAWLGQSQAQLTVWSPYQKLALSPYYVANDTNRIQRGYLLEVNGTHFQFMVDGSERIYANHPDSFSTNDVMLGELNTPFRFKPAPHRILIVGAGTGNNAAEALRAGVEHIDCVEIDPQIYALGKQFHPEHPYDSPRVHMVIDDARAFFKHATGPYDVIWFAWLDAHSQASSYNNLRLDHYVYTEQSIAEAKQLLADDGLLFVNFHVIRPWIGDRLFVLLRDVFGHDPLVYRKIMPAALGRGGNQYVLVISKTSLSPSELLYPALRAAVAANAVEMPGTTRPTTDDWPYLYLKGARIPNLHLVALTTVFAIVALANRRLLGSGQSVDWHFFALGAAFLLLEVQAVSRATLLFGMTWMVNAIVISAVLVMILAANVVAAHHPLRTGWLSVTGLFLTISVLAFLPLDRFNMLTGETKLLAAGVFLTAPVFFAGLIFIRSFAKCADKSRALGSNLIGALVGGALESISFVTGIRALVLLVGLFYVLALCVYSKPRALET